MRAASVPAADAERTCLDTPPRAVEDPERDLVEVEAIVGAIKSTTMSGVCAALAARDLDGVATHLAPLAHVERLFPRAETVLGRGPAGTASLVTPQNPGCLGDGKDFADDLRRLLGGWARIERCFFKPYRVFATRQPPRRAVADLHLWLGGVEPDGARVGEKGDVRAELVEQSDGRWLLSRLTFDPRERFVAPAPAFEDWTERAGLPTMWPDLGYRTDDLAFGQILYGGVAVADYDGDRWPDIYLARAGPNVLLRNDGQGGFVDVTRKAGVGDPGNSQAALFADLDNDGDADLFVVNAYYSLVTGQHSRRGHVLYRSEGDGRFTRVGSEWGPIGPASGVSAADYDGDGLLDLYVTYYQDENLHPFHHFVEARDGFGNRLYRNRGGLQFEDVTKRAGVGGRGWSYASAWADFDEDGRVDLYVANDFGDSALYRNRGDGGFDDVAAAAGVLNSANGMSADWGDYDNDGRLDVYVANMYSKTGRQFLPLQQGLDEALRRKLDFSVQGNALYRNLGDGTFSEVGRQLGASVAGWAWGSNFLDYDNDGWLDLHVANGFWAGPAESDA